MSPQQPSPTVLRPVYGIDQRPARALESILYGWQHTLVDISPFVLPLAVAHAIGLDASGQAQLINACLFAMGLATLIQTTIGNRLPIIQGPSATLTSSLAPVASQLGAPAMWGGVAIGAAVETLLGASRLVGALRRFLPPAVSGVVIVSIGLALGRVAVRLVLGNGENLNTHLGLAGFVVALILVLQYAGRGLAGGLIARGAIFFSIWVVGLGFSGVFGLVDWRLVASKPWLSLPRLFPWGSPWSGADTGWTLAAAAVAVILAGYFGSMIESLGDYAATCAVAGERLTARHMNRGIFAEGVGCLVAACFGALPCTSYTQNIGIIATTRVASRFVVQLAAGVLLLYGLCPKFGALLVAMPRAVLGGVFVLVCGMIVASGIRLLASVPATAANFTIIGTTLVVAVAVPVQVAALDPEVLARLPAALCLLLRNSVVLAVGVGVGMNLVVGELLGRLVASRPQGSAPPG